MYVIFGAGSEQYVNDFVSVVFGEGNRLPDVEDLALESNRPESEVIKEMQEPGCLLFDEKVFSFN